MGHQTGKGLTARFPNKDTAQLPTRSADRATIPRPRWWERVSTYNQRRHAGTNRPHGARQAAGARLQERLTWLHKSRVWCRVPGRCHSGLQTVTPSLGTTLSPGAFGKASWLRVRELGQHRQVGEPRAKAHLEKTGGQRGGRGSFP